MVPTKNSDDIVTLDEVLKQLSALNERKQLIVELKFFGGLTMEEITEVLKILPETVKRNWLLRELTNKA